MTTGASCSSASTATPPAATSGSCRRASSTRPASRPARGRRASWPRRGGARRAGPPPRGRSSPRPASPTSASPPSLPAGTPPRGRGPRPRRGWPRPPARSAPERRTVLDAATVAQLRDADALVEVVRGFPDVAGAPPTPAADLEGFAAELVLADLAVVEKRLERLKKEKGHERERALLERLAPSLEAGTPLRTLGLAPEERALLAGFAFLSLRPLLVVLNVPEAAAAVPLPGEVATRAQAEGAEAMALSARLEAEIAELEPADRDAFLADLGLAESARVRFRFAV